jgi:hypothetical protein
MTEHTEAELTGAPDADGKRLALEIIASLVNVKKTAADQLLRRSGVPEDLIRRFLTERDPATGDKRSKREAGALMLDELGRGGTDHAVYENSSLLPLNGLIFIWPRTNTKRARSFKRPANCEAFSTTQITVSGQRQTLGVKFERSKNGRSERKHCVAKANSSWRSLTKPPLVLICSKGVTFLKISSIGLLTFMVSRSEVVPP